MITRTVHASKPYDVMIGDGLLDRVGSLIAERCTSRRIAIITDNVVDALHGKRLRDSLTTNGLGVVQFTFPNGEKSKNIQTLTDILEFLAENDFTRQDRLVRFPVAWTEENRKQLNETHDLS